MTSDRWKMTINRWLMTDENYWRPMKNDKWQTRKDLEAEAVRKAGALSDRRCWEPEFREKVRRRMWRRQCRMRRRTKKRRVAARTRSIDATPACRDLMGMLTYFNENNNNNDNIDNNNNNKDDSNRKNNNNDINNHDDDDGNNDNNVL